MRACARALPLLLLVAGCGGAAAPAVHSPAAYDPEALTAAAFEAYDRDRNGFLDRAELDACPALKGALAGIDTNRDGKISRDELRARFEGYRLANAGTVSVAASVTLDGAPLPEAVVRFVPEPFLGNTVKETTGRTGADGAVASFTSEGRPFAGIQPGMYRVQITREGGKALPARYNTQTTLGAEVFGGRGSSILVFALSSR